MIALLVPLFIGLALRASVEGTADASALAAADVASGIFPGSPCEVATTVARGNGASVTACDVDGLVVTVVVKVSFWGIPLVATATAGPPQSGNELGDRRVDVCMVSLTEAAIRLNLRHKEESRAGHEEAGHRRVACKGENDRPVPG
jgi:secretion/DNA translocation related TadE-like protein